MYLNLLENEQTVELFKQSPYSEKFQREMTVAEYSAGKRAYYNAREFFSEFISKPFNLETLGKTIQ